MTGAQELGESILGTNSSGREGRKEERHPDTSFTVCLRVAFLLLFQQDVLAGMARLLYQGWTREVGIGRIFMSVDPECRVVGAQGQASMENLGVLNSCPWSSGLLVSSSQPCAIVFFSPFWPVCFITRFPAVDAGVFVLFCFSGL